MRAEQKKQAEDFLKLLETAHEEIKKALEKREATTALTLLEDCQNGAIALGNMIERIEGEKASTIPILEEYCNRVYWIYESLTDGNVDLDLADKIHKTLRSSFIRIENSVKQDIKVFLEVVFLPYKASMWDSLESIWQAARDEPYCNAYVIPIPYYDKNPDGSFGNQHYEIGQYPKYVPVMSYKDYDFEKRKPDMIFIHNPYDECNYVTSVHPFFYSKNLKRFTKKLVYIPYFILGDVNPTDQGQIKGMEHFCTVPGVLYADKVIVQSENMRRVYIDVLQKKTHGNNNRMEQRRYWENKILGWGSPKMDKVLSTKREDMEIPADWMRVIRKPSGEWKKIILYNTGVSALLKYEEAMLDKMRRVFRIFQENREETALLWRPHPLIPATIESMRPQLWKEYQRLVTGYREAGWGIYDDSAELNRAIAVSDGYYGDPSSLVPLCKSAGIPVMVQNVEIQ